MLNLQPRRLGSGETETHQLTGSGSFALNLPGLLNQRLVLHGTFDFNAREELQHIEIALGLHQPRQNVPGTTFLLDGSPALDQWHYSLHRGNMVLKESAGRFAQLLDDPDLHALGFDPKLVGELSHQQASGTTITARHGTLRINGEEVETYLVTVQQAGGLESTVHLNQLGQILAVKTFLGYDLYNDEFTP